MSVDDVGFLSLTHFCDKHGPKVLMVTQMASDLARCNELLLPEYPKDSYCESCLLRLPEPKSNATSIRSSIDDFYSVSTQYSSIRYQLLSMIIKKTFSEETMSYDGSPFMFCDEHRGLNLAVGFKLEDVHARGNERRYCLILSLEKRNPCDGNDVFKTLSGNWQFIIESLSKLIDHIKIQAREQLNRRQTDFAQIMGGTYLRENKQKLPVSLADIVNDQLIFLRIHKWNTFILTRLKSAQAETLDSDGPKDAVKP
ncbi:Lst7 [Kluyveromyces lactis]|nr:Lst7 [Kluyveromyces lactis]